jgi:hypothetical protein
MIDFRACAGVPGLIDIARVLHGRMEPAMRISA